MDNSVCKKVSAMLSLYIDNKLNDEHKKFVEKHFLNCPKCFQQYKDMKNIIENLKDSYDKILKEIESIDTVNLFNIREYERFYSNISAYIDNELCYEDSIDFRKYVLKSKAARRDLTNIYNLKNHMQNSIESVYKNYNSNLSSKVIKIIKNEQQSVYQKFFYKAAILAGILIFSGSGFYVFTHTDKINPEHYIKKQKNIIYVKNKPSATKFFDLVSRTD